VALLQEAPPRWFRPLAGALRASGALALTSRNLVPVLQRRLADWNPDLLASWEGGSNQLLVRGGRLLDVRRMTLASVPERRRMLWGRVEHPRGRVCVANLHASAAVPVNAAAEVEAAAEQALAWAGGDPLVFGGDLNLRPARNPEPFAALRDRFGLAAPTARDAIDHILAGGLETVEAPRRLKPERRELPGPQGRAIRLSDHTPVSAAFALSA
jgi:endonuclease/exonuclease/phosphatase family metal-dependent hydrolase